MQIFVHSRGVSVLYLDITDVMGLDLRKEVSRHENLPMECFYMNLEGHIVNDEDLLKLEDSMNLRVLLKLVGGKGGFGAMLKSGRF